MEDAIVQIQGLSKVFSKPTTTAIKNLDIAIPKGKMVGLIGPDGSGKTTLLRLIAGLLTPTNGAISVGGYDTMKDAEIIRYFIGYMPQKFGLYEDLTVQQNLNLYAALRNVVGEEREQAFEKLLEFTSLKPFTKRLAKNLSGGMKQKLGLGCALIKKPELLLLDEPSVGVDPLSRRDLWKMVEELLGDGITVIWSTAYLDEAEQCESAYLLKEGELVYSGDPKEFTVRAKGRVYSVTNIEGDRRELLFEISKNPDVLDGVIQGEDLRILLKEGAHPIEDVQMNLVPPRFEDAFIDSLGGSQGSVSKLAEKAPVVDRNGVAPIVAKDLTKIFGDYTAVDSINIEVKQGEVFGLLGPNGAGKTTTFKMLCGLLKPTHGTAHVFDLDLQSAPSAARSKIGYMAQKFSLYGNLSVKQNLDFFAGIYELENQKKKTAIEQMIETFGLEEYLGVSAETLPLGYKQRLSLACANMHHPPVLFLDEPTSGVDPLTRREFWNHINGLVRKGVTIMVTTHFMEEAEYCDRIALIYQGKMVKLDTPAALKKDAYSEKNPNPTLEDAFIHMIEEYDKK